MRQVKLFWKHGLNSMLRIKFVAEAKQASAEIILLYQIPISDSPIVFSMTDDSWTLIQIALR